jgi:hypothetical protein
MKTSVATVTLVGMSPLSHSRQHDDPWLDGERPEDYDNRTWRSKLNVGVRDGKPTVVHPAHGILQCFASGARYSKRKIEGQGQATWTAKFEAGLAVLEDPALNIDPETVVGVTISCNVDGVRGSGKRVPRKFPVMPVWETTFDVLILDPIITETIFREMVEIAGLYVGLGRFRPGKGGTNGRFALKKLVWADNRQLLAA